jgi:hypothetical protein
MTSVIDVNIQEFRKFPGLVITPVKSFLRKLIEPAIVQNLSDEVVTGRAEYFPPKQYFFKVV